MNIPVDFENAKLLQKADFQIDNRTYGMGWYNELGIYLGRTDLNKEGESFSEVYPEKKSFYGSPINPEDKAEFKLKSFLAPTITDVIDWFKKVHNIQIFLDYAYYDGFHYGVKWVKSNGDYGEIWRDNNGEMADGCDSWEEAYQIAIETLLLNILLKKIKKETA